VKIEPKFRDVEFFSDGLCAVLDTAETHKYGFINTKGEFAITPQFDDANVFKNGLATVQIGEKYGVIDKTGKYVINPQFDYMLPDGNLFLIGQDNKYGWCDKTGKYVINPQFDAVSSFYGGNFAAVESGDKWGYVDKKGKFEINPQFDRAYSFIGNIAPVKTGNQWGFIDKKGKFEINPQFKSIAEYDIVIYLSGYRGASVTSDYFNAEDIVAAFNFTSPEGLTAASTYNEVMRIFGLSESSLNKYSKEYKALSGKKIGSKVKCDFFVHGTPYDEQKSSSGWYTSTNYIFDGTRKPDYYSYLIFADTEDNAKAIYDLFLEKWKVWKEKGAINLTHDGKRVGAAFGLQYAEANNLQSPEAYKEMDAKYKKFLEDNGKRSGVKTTASGLQYEILTEGSGAKPVATDKVKVHYTGKLIDGTVFDSSVERGKPAIFGLNQVIKGWTEGLQLMSKGAKYKFYIPSELAYGEKGAGEKIPPLAALIFDVELLEINPADE
jgi:FKBP-type peptidyl-prolyl cis-trans isomerase